MGRWEYRRKKGNKGCRTIGNGENEYGEEIKGQKEERQQLNKGSKRGENDEGSVSKSGVQLRRG